MTSPAEDGLQARCKHMHGHGVVCTQCAAVRGVRSDLSMLQNGGSHGAPRRLSACIRGAATCGSCLSALAPPSDSIHSKRVSHLGAVAEGDDLCWADEREVLWERGGRARRLDAQDGCVGGRGWTCVELVMGCVFPLETTGVPIIHPSRQLHGRYDCGCQGPAVCREGSAPLSADTEPSNLGRWGGGRGVWGVRVWGLGAV